MHLLVECITDPNLSLVWGQPNPMTWASMAFDRSLLKTGNFYPMQHLVCRQVTHFKSQQFVDADVTTCLTTINGERTDTGREGADGFFDRMRRGLSNSQ